jgi:hypothetical protein
VVISDCALQLYGPLRIRLYGAFDPAILERAVEGVIAEFAGQLGSVEFKLQVAVIGFIEELEDRNPLAWGRRLAENRPRKEEQGHAGAHARYDIRQESRRPARLAERFGVF